MSIELATPCAEEHRVAILERIRARKATAQDFIAYNLLRGKPAIQGFRPYTNPKSLENGRSPFEGFLRASQESFWTTHRLAPALSPMLNDEQRSKLRVAHVRALCDAVHRAREQGLSQGHLRGLLTAAMRAVPQGSGSVLEHCRLTASHGRLLLRAARSNGGPLLQPQQVPAWLPDWFLANKAFFCMEGNTYLLEEYLANHDCGKPFVYTEDGAGRAHFPEHSTMSAQVWAQVGGSADAQYLIARDMDLHVMKAEQLEAFAKTPLAKVQLLAALASLWANQADFGGVESVSFKSKLKHLDRRGRALCKIWAAREDGADSR